MKFSEQTSSIIHILGLGESLDEYQPDGNTTIGVNDIWSRHETDYVVCVDRPSVFTADRLKTIQQTKCKGFYSHIKEWDNVCNYQHIEFAPGRANLDYLDSDKLITSNSSPYVAVILAYKFGAKEIVIHGCDYRTHPNFSNNSLDMIRLHFKQLSTALKKRGVQLMVGSEWSMLSEFLPIKKPTT